MRRPRELGNQKGLQSSLTRDAIFTTQANLTQNKVIRGLEYYDEFLERIHYDYDAWFEYAKSNVQQEYRDIYIKSIGIKNLRENFIKELSPSHSNIDGYRFITEHQDEFRIRWMLKRMGSL